MRFALQPLDLLLLFFYHAKQTDELDVVHQSAPRVDFVVVRFDQRVALPLVVQAQIEHALVPRQTWVAVGLALGVGPR